MSVRLSALNMGKNSSALILRPVWAARKASRLTLPAIR
jgi:hypothetical protein